MATAMTLQHFIESHHVACGMVPHERTATAFDAAQAAHVDADSVAKAVMVGDDRGLLMAVVPASHLLKLRRLRQATGRPLQLVSERAFVRLFPDCDLGAIPALGEAYGIEMIWDDCLADQTRVYLEAGDHESLMEISCRDFIDLAGASRHACISVHR